MLSQTVQDYLVKHHIPYEQVRHPRTATAEETAHAMGVSAKKVAKTVVVRIEGQMAMIVLHADERIDLAKLKSALGVQSVELCSEADFKDRFPGCELGAMPPFGELYRMPVLVSESVAQDEDISLNGGGARRCYYHEVRRFRETRAPGVRGVYVPLIGPRKGSRVLCSSV